MKKCSGTGTGSAYPDATTHLKILAFQFLSLTQQQPHPSSSRSSLISRAAETVGIVVAMDRRPSFLRFLIDDGTGCIPCVLWLNQLDSPYYSRHSPSHVRLLADAAASQASAVQQGLLARVRGGISSYRGRAEISVRDVVVERDPNAEILHWLDCIRLSIHCYNNAHILRSQSRK
ncbi:hypothetical protein ACLOJK_021238 [Asimina triloba]